MGDVGGVPPAITISKICCDIVRRREEVGGEKQMSLMKFELAPWSYICDWEPWDRTVIFGSRNGVDA